MLIMTLYSMVFFHIIADFNSQGVLCDLKQKEWWRENAPQRVYRNDWKVALLIHSLMWTIMIMIPICWAYVDDVSPIMYTLSLIINTAVHMKIDHLKCNAHKINLMQDQVAHAVQLLITFAVFSM